MEIEGTSFLRGLLHGHYGKEETNPIRRAVLDSTYFLHPDVVAESQLLPIVRARRLTAGERKNTVVNGDFVSDNFPPDYVFRAATGDSRHQSSTQLCHVYGGNGEARDPYLYTNLANLCLMPSFLAKFSDTDPTIVRLLKECSFVLFGFDPAREISRGAAPTARREEIKLASPLSGKLFHSLVAKRDARFANARSAGFLFSDDGQVRATDPWVAAMIARRDAIAAGASSKPP